ncbi:MAG: hypothetical protein AAF645_24380, partial [Myxococcota bacterium]
MAELEIDAMSKQDFDTITSVLDRWWGGPAGQRADPPFFYELGAGALVARQDGQIAGFLLGFVAPLDPPIGFDYPNHQNYKLAQIDMLKGYPRSAYH